MNNQKVAMTEQALTQEAVISPLNDIIVAGFVDDEGMGKMFHPMLNNVYLKVGTALFMLSSVEQYSVLAISQVTKIECNFDLDEDDEFCTCSMCNFYFGAPYADNWIRGVEFFEAAAEENGVPVLSAMGLLLKYGEYIFFDSLNYFGIAIGGRDLRERWLSQNPTAISRMSEVLESPATNLP